ncbi:hypothetical protein ACETIH_20775 [Microvirga arabica]|uniref:Hemopexin n=1 Tax=Microvirga arabica TaxID=1128671 RepID=A0ABV6YD71_9HYPH
MPGCSAHGDESASGFKMIETYTRLGSILVVALSLSTASLALDNESTEPPPPISTNGGPITRPPLGLASQYRCAHGVTDQFDKMQNGSWYENGELRYSSGSFSHPLGVREHDWIYGWRYTKADHNIGPIPDFPDQPGGNNHFQGLIRFGNPWAGWNFIVCSGGDWHYDFEGGSHLFFAHLPSREDTHIYPFTSGWAQTSKSNFSYDSWWRWNMPDGRDHIYHKVRLDNKAEGPNKPGYWHAGGIQEYEGIMAVALEDGDWNVGKIVFVDVSNPWKPYKIDGLEIKTPRKIGAAAITRNRDNHWVVATWVDYEMTFYISRTPDIRSGFIHLGIGASDSGYNHTKIPGPGSIDSSLGRYQSISLINGCDGRFYIAATNNDGLFGSSVIGTNWIDIYGLFPGDGVPGRYFIRKIWKKKFVLSDRVAGPKFADFNMAAGIHVSINGKIMMYASDGWRDMSNTGARWLSFREFAAP